MPLDNKKYDFRYLQKSDEGTMANLKASLDKISESDELEVNYNPYHVYTNDYEYIHP